MLIGQAPVNATGGAIRLWSIFPPVGQRGAGKQQGIDPSKGNDQTAVEGVKPVPCENTLSSISLSMYLKDSGKTIIYRFAPKNDATIR